MSVQLSFCILKSAAIMGFYSENTYIHAEYYKLWQKNKPHGTHIVADQAIKRQIGHWTLFQSLFPTDYRICSYFTALLYHIFVST